MTEASDSWFSVEEDSISGYSVADVNVSGLSVAGSPLSGLPKAGVYILETNILSFSVSDLSAAVASASWFSVHGALA